MTKKHYFWLFALCIGNEYASQITKIDSVVIRDPLLENQLVSQKIISLKDTEIQKNTTNLSENLRFQSPIFIKENGRGMASSPSVRGTSAQQTAFLWNGIQINSLFLGQGDINTLGLLGYDTIVVKIGAGSLRLGSGAMGASVHLNNDLPYNKGWNGSLLTEYGSYNTSNNAVKIGFGNEKFSVKVNTSYSQSDNDYEIAEKKYINRNGQYHQLHYGMSAGYRFSPHHEMTIHSQFHQGTQHFPIFDTTTLPTKYHTGGLKTLLNYKYQGERFKNQTTTAYIEDEFNYFGNIQNTEPSSGGLAKTLIVRNLSYITLTQPALAFSIMGEFQHNAGIGKNSGIIHPKRDWGYAYFGAVKKWTNAHSTELSIRKNFIKNISSPLLFSLGNKLKVSPLWTTYINISNNFRLPSFNDLYWQPGGNPALRPEIAWQFESMQSFRIIDFQIDIIPFLSYFKDKLQWTPTELGYWAPKNMNKVTSYGSEIYLLYKKKIHKNILELKANYAYTRSIDVNTKLQNMYIPIHKASGTLSFSAPQWNIYAQGLFNGRTYTTTDEDVNAALKPYFITNLGVQISMIKNLSLGGKVNNIFNQIYYTTAYYPLPLRNYSVQIAYQF